MASNIQVIFKYPLIQLFQPHILLMLQVNLIHL